MSYNRDYLMHFGIKGQRWGVRRFQNEDGTLTNAGKSRYQRGKEYAKERDKIADKELESMRKNSKEYQEALRESNMLLEKYGLDADDGGGGDTEKYDDATLRRAGDRYWQRMTDAELLDDQFMEKATKKAESQIIKKYGDQALSDIKHYNSMRAVNWLVGIGGVATAFLLAGSKRR